MSLGTLYSSDELCPFTHRILVAKEELGAEVTEKYMPEIPAAIRERNTGGGWPVFVPADNGDLMTDSAAIVEYLIAQSGGDSYRSDTDTLAKLNRLIQSMSKVILAGKPSMQKEFRAKLDAAMTAVAQMLAATGGPFLQGEEFSQADGHVAPFLYRLPFLVEIRDHLPQALRENAELVDWIDRVVNRASFRKIAPKRDALRRLYANKAKY
jgi:glutathione S-transferase